jgi:hypothetical protein
MIARISCKAVRYHGRLVADDLASCCRDYILGLARLQFFRGSKRDEGLMGRIQSARRLAVDELTKGGKAV